MSYPRFPVVSKHLYVPPVDEIEDRLRAHLLRMTQNLDPSQQVLRSKQKNKVFDLAERAHKRRRQQISINNLSDEQRFHIRELARDGASICGPVTSDAVDACGNRGRRSLEEALANGHARQDARKDPLWMQA